MEFNKVLENVTTYEAGKPIELVVREYGVKPENVKNILLKYKNSVKVLGSYVKEINDI